MRKFLTISLLMMSIFATVMSGSAYSADETIVIPAGKTRAAITGEYSGNSKEAQVNNDGIINKIYNFKCLY